MNKNNKNLPVSGASEEKSQFFKTKNQVQEWLKKTTIYNYTLAEDLRVSVEGHVQIKTSQIVDLKLLPVQFDTVHGNFDCSGLGLTSLKGTPKRVGGVFTCAHNELVDLQNGPEIVNDNYLCHNNQLMTLKGAPVKTRNFHCANNQLKNLIGAPLNVVGFFNCSKNQLKTLKGSPHRVLGFVFAQYNELETLESKFQSFKEILLGNQRSGILSFLEDQSGEIDLSYSAFQTLLEKYKLEKKVALSVNKSQKFKI